MAKLELEIDDVKGEVVGDIPEALKAIFTRLETTAHQTGFGKGAQKTAEEAKAQIAKEVAAARAEAEAAAPLKAEKYSRMEEEYKSLQTRLLEQEREHDRTLKSQGENHARELLDRSDRLKKLSGRITDLTKGQLKSEARAHGAREESLDELEVILHSHIGYSDDMEPFVKNGDGSARTVQGKPMSIGSFVKEYLDGHSHHKAPARGQGGGARGGASFNSNTGPTPTADAARNRIIEGGDRSSDAINDLFLATRRKPA